MKNAQVFENFVKTIRRLRDPVGGCPWDLKQTQLSLRPYLLEECYELLEAIESSDQEEVCGELGDVLLQVVLHAQIASDNKDFTIEDVVSKIDQKIIRRHPHVFEDTTALSEEDVKRNWERIKLEERKKQKKLPITTSKLFSGVPKALPGLARAFRLGEKASHVGFDWNEVSGVRAKLEEEIQELNEELDKECLEADGLEHELGDVLFSLAQFCRHLKLSPEDCLRKANSRFESRFSKMEELLEVETSEASPEQLDEAWERAKTLLSK